MRSSRVLLVALVLCLAVFGLSEAKVRDSLALLLEGLRHHAKTKTDR